MDIEPRPLIEQSVTCACGAVNLSAKGRVRVMFLCSCRDCQVATGSGHSALFLMRASDVAVSGATGQFSRPAWTGATLTRHFCPTCGTPLHGQTTRSPNAILLPAGLFQTEGWYRPDQLIFARDHCLWDTIDADLTQNETYAADGPL